MATSYLTHTATEGERWDMIADRYYGDAYAYAQIVIANPNVAIAPLLSAGTQLLIPIVETADTLLADLPPWKR